MYISQQLLFSEINICRVFETSYSGIQVHYYTHDVNRCALSSVKFQGGGYTSMHAIEDSFL